MRVVRSVVVLVAASLGLLTTFAGPVQAMHVIGNHCEPVRRR
jgi:hypothetical protein